MNPLLLLQLKRILVSLTILLNLLTAQVAVQNKHLLGTATVTAGDNYPTSTYSFSDNDIINAGDLNLITTYTGIRTATDTISLQGQIYNVSSTANNPPVSTATGTLPVANGGTGTSTYIYGVVVASDTNKFTTITPGISGQILTSNGTTWAAASLASSTWTKQIFNASTTWTVPSGITTIFLTMVGGGGGGGGGSTGGSSGAGGGGSGAALLRFPTSTTPSTNITIVVGQGGAGGTVGANSTGTAGLASTIGTLSAGGGGGGGGGSSVVGPGGSAGVSSATLWNGSAGSAGSGATGGNGGSGWYGIGGTGFSNSTGTAGIGYGAGGGAGTISGSGWGGGNGSNGVVIIEY